MVLFGPGAALLGGIGTWLLLRKGERGASPQALRTTGIALGVAFGGICPSLYIVWLWTLWLIQGDWPDPATWVREWMDGSRLPYIVAYELIGMVTGVILGWIVAHRLARRAKNSDH